MVSFATSAIGAISGIGGGVILKPVLDMALDQNAGAISFMSGCTVFAMSALSLYRCRIGPAAVDTRRGVPLAIGAAAGGLVGKQLFSLLLRFMSNASMVTAIQSLILCLLTMAVMVYMRIKHRLRPIGIQSSPMCLVLGLSLGVMSSFLGIGGGPINIAAISFFLAMDARTTAIHSLLAIFFSQMFSIGATVIAGEVPAFDYVLLLPLIFGAFVGAMSGSAIARKSSNGKIEKLFMIVLLLVALISGYNTASNWL